MKITIQPELRPSARLALLVAEEVRIARRQEVLWGQFQILARSVRETARGRNPAENGDLSKVKRFLKGVGLDPERFRPSSEVLLRKALKNLPINQVNSVVDAVSYLALDSLLPVSCYDLGRVKGDIELRLGRAGERFDTPARDKFDAAGVPVLADAHGAFGSLLADSARTAVGQGARRLLLVVYACGAVSESALNQCLDNAAKLLSQFSLARIAGRHLLADEVEVA